MSDLPRLSPYNIEDDIYRALLYKEIRDNQDNTDWQVYEVQPADELYPELISYKVYNDEDTTLKWVILVAAGLDDMRERIDAGTVLRLPDVTWIRENIKKYAEY